MAPNKIKPPSRTDLSVELIKLFVRAEQQIVSEINRKRAAGFVDYAETAALDRVQEILNNLVAESYDYVPSMIEKAFSLGRRNAGALTTAQMDVAQVLTNNLLGTIAEAAETSAMSARNIIIGRLEAGALRETTVSSVAKGIATGRMESNYKIVNELNNKGITAFIDKSGREWSLQSYTSMATRTTMKQAQVAAILTRDEHDLYQIVRNGTTCPVCAPLEGRVYSKSGNNPDYPPLAAAFGKINAAGGNDLGNTYLNIHPNCLHALVKYTEAGKSENEVRKIKDFSSLEKNPLTHDPRTKRQIAEYRKKEQERQKLLNDYRQFRRYKNVLGEDVPKTFQTFRKHKLQGSEKYELWQQKYRKTNRQIKEITGGDAV